MTTLRSKDNPLLRRWRKLVADRRARRDSGRAWIEGTRLIGSYLECCGPPVSLVVSESAMNVAAVVAIVERSARKPVVLEARLFASLADTETPQGIAAEIEIPPARPDPGDAAQCVFLDGVQDPGNVGTLLRSARAFGIAQVVLGPGCADPWSPKVLRAAMGAHFALRLSETDDLAGPFARFQGNRICTSAREGTPLAALDLSGRNAWAFGGEARGLSDALRAHASLEARIPIAAAAESLNVAVAASICLYEAARQRAGEAARQRAREAARPRSGGAQ